MTFSTKAITNHVYDNQISKMIFIGSLCLCQSLISKFLQYFIVSCRSLRSIKIHISSETIFSATNFFQFTDDNNYQSYVIRKYDIKQNELVRRTKSFNQYNIITYLYYIGTIYCSPLRQYRLCV